MTDHPPTDAHPDVLPRALVERVVARLGITPAPTRDLDGLRGVYAAWCARVPFDNVRKMIALRTEAPGPLPGTDAVDFFEHWLEHGTGGTCWPSSNALFTLVRALGFDARRVAASMRDMGGRNHGSVKARFGDRDWLVDSSMLTISPLPLGNAVFVGGDPLVPVEIEPASPPAEGTHVLWFDQALGAGWLACRLLDDPVDHGFYADAYERSRAVSPFNAALMMRRNLPGEVRILRGAKWTRRTAGGIASGEHDAGALRRALVETCGLSEEIVEAWARCGALEASLAPLAAPPPLEGNALPPSRRG